MRTNVPPDNVVHMDQWLAPHLPEDAEAIALDLLRRAEEEEGPYSPEQREQFLRRFLHQAALGCRQVAEICRRTRRG